MATLSTAVGPEHVLRPAASLRHTGREGERNDRNGGRRAFADERSDARVGDLARSKKFYAEGLGCAIEKDFPKFVSLSLGDGAPYLSIYEREAAAQDAGVSAEGSGFTGISFHYTVGSHEAVDELMSSAVAAGGGVVRQAAAAQWGGYSGYFSDPDGYLWKVACPS